MSLRPPSMVRLLLLLIVPVFVIATPAAADDYPHLRLGNPSNATDDTSVKDNFLLKKKFFALSYNNQKGTPNWVSWRLRSDDLGNVHSFPFKPWN